MRDRLPLPAALLAMVLCLQGCAIVDPGSGGEVLAIAGGETRFRVETVASGLEVPWSLAFAPDGRMFFTERPGRVRVITPRGRLLNEPLLTIEEVEASSESGLLGMALHPGFRRNGLVYLAYTAYGNDGLRIRIVRYRDSRGTLRDREVVFDNIPTGHIHVGGRIAFGPDGKLYVTVGDAGRRELAQQLDSLSGKTLRLNDDGSVPDDNPFVDVEGARPEIWSYGHRNSQGMDWQPGTGLMFQTEHGPSWFDGPTGGDEINIIEKGLNYGWPVIHHDLELDGMEKPFIEYTPSVAPSGASFHSGRTFPEFAGNFLVGCLHGRRIIRISLRGRQVKGQEMLLEQHHGRIRAVAEGPDGLIYFSTSNRDGNGVPEDEDDRIMRIIPIRQHPR